jgi:hypothetical protein
MLTSVDVREKSVNFPIHCTSSELLAKNQSSGGQWPASHHRAPGSFSGQLTLVFLASSPPYPCNSPSIPH